ncbi:Mov34/MPN/PAD-1 family protein [Halonatronum saccharophilum]|uniref:Mov34/MPN/PAD-1 family protein n=1 Tax=Halonatronum saccharophilum TaxID=150060 RepID=UPI0004872B91
MVKLDQRLYEKMLAQAKEEFPNECCGLVAGESGEDIIEVKEVFPMTNLDASAEHFSMDPKEQFAVVKEIRCLGYDLLGNYHSHPFTPSRPSYEDKRLAYDEGAIYFILSLKKRDEPVLNAFKIKGRSEVTKLEVKIVEGGEFNE